MASPSNPCSWFISGSDEARFLYEPGDKPFYVQMRELAYIRASLLLWANDAQHARRILREMVDFGLAAIGKRKAAGQWDPPTHNVIDEQRKQRLNMLKLLLDGKEAEDALLTIVEFDRRHPVKVAWSSNDTVF